MKRIAKNRGGWRILKRVCVACAAVMLGLVAMELAARAVYDRNGMHYGIEMWKYARLVKRRSSNDDLSHEHIPGAKARLMGVDVQINSCGLRDREFPKSKHADDYRILVLGDSITFGWGVAAENTYCKVLERMLNRHPPCSQVRRYEVINAGVGNYNTAQEVAWFQQHGVAYQPDMVILGFYINDAEPTPKPHGGFLAKHFYLYVVISSARDGFSRRIGLAESFTDYYRHLYTSANPGWRKCQTSLRRLAQLCHRERTALIVALIPELHQDGKAYPFKDVHARVSQLVEQAGVQVLDLQDAFLGPNPHSLWVSPGDAHPNAAAHRIIAHRIYSQIELFQTAQSGN